MLRVIRNHRRAAHGEHAGYEGLAYAAGAARSRRLPRRGANRARRRAPGTRRWRRANSTAIATRRSLSSRRPARSASSWIATRPASSPISRSSNSRSSRAAAISRSSTAPCRKALRALGYRESEIAEIEAYAVGHASLSNAPAINTGVAARQGLSPTKSSQRVEKALAGGVRHQIRLQQMDARRRLPHRRAEDSGRERSRTRISTCSRILASRAARSTPPIFISAAR